MNFLERVFHRFEKIGESFTNRKSWFFIFLFYSCTNTITVKAAPLNGQIFPDPNNPSWLVYNKDEDQNGKLDPFFMCGPGDPEEFLYRGTRNSDGTRNGDQMALINKLIGTGANSIYMQAIRSHGGDGNNTHNPFVNSDPNQGFDQDILDQWETWFTAMDNNGIVIFFFFYDDSARIWDTGTQVGAAERAFIQELVNRFEHHKHLIWCIAEEYTERYTSHRARNIAAEIRAADDFDHAISIHKLNGLVFSEFATDPNIDQFAIQINNRTEGQLHSDMITAWNEAGGRYNLNMAESAGHGGSGNRQSIRQKNWASALGGAYVMIYQMFIDNTPLSQLEDAGRLVDFMESTNFNEMSPHDELALGGADYVLASPGESYIIYAKNAPNGVGIKGLTPGTYTIKWFDVIDGNTIVQGNVNVQGGDQNWNKPAGVGSEMAVYITRSQDPTPPETPQNVQATPLPDSRIELSWSPSSDPETGVAHYNIYRNNVNITTSINTSLTDDDVLPNTTYLYEITAVNGAGLESTKSSPPISSSTLGDLIAPTIVNAIPNSNLGEITIEFSEPLEATSAELVANYSISQGIEIFQATLHSAEKIISLRTSILTEGVTYTITINNLTDQAAAANQIASDSQITFTPPFTLPSSPTNLSATSVSSSQINLDWRDNSNNESSFVIEKIVGSTNELSIKLENYSGLNLNPTVEEAGTTNSFKVGALQTNDRSATWSAVPESLDGAPRLLCARNDKSDSGYNSMYEISLNTSSSVYAVVSPEYGDSPMEFMDGSWTNTGLTATSEGLIFKIWKKEASAGNLILGADNKNDKQGACYVFQSDSIWSEIGTVNANVTHFQDTDLLSETSYKYRIRALNDAGKTEPSNEDSATTSAINAPPSVNAGIDLIITLPTSASLNGSISDDGLPILPGITTAEWTLKSGPGLVTFENQNAAATTADFSQAGVYTLLLTGNDGEFSTIDEVIVTINEKPVGQLLASFSFEGNASDLSGSGNHGEIYGCTLTSGVAGQGYEFDGNNDYIAIQSLNFSDQGALEALSVCSWVQTTYRGDNAFGNWSILDFDRNENFSFFVNGTNGNLGFSTTDETGNTDDFYGNASVNDGKWHQICAVYDGADKILYVDGIEDSRNPGVHSGLKLGSGVNTRFGFIGDGSEADSYNGTRNYYYYEGLIDELKLYNRALSASEILQQFNEITLPDPNDDLLFRYSFDGNIENIGGGNNNGENFGASVVSGVSGQAYEFDGENDYVAIHDLSFSSQGEIEELTICGWVRTTFSGNEWYDNWALLDFDRNEYFALFIRGDNGTLGFSTTDSNGNFNDFFGTTLVNDGEWHFVAAVYNGQDKILYVDGVEDLRLVNAHGSRDLGSGNNTRCGFIGDGSEAVEFNGLRNGIHYKGLVDELNLFSRALSSYEIQDKFQEITVPDSNQDLILSYSFDGNATDSSGNNYNGQIHSATSVPGKIGQAYSFDGQGDYIAIESLNFSAQGEIDNISICSWINTSHSGCGAFDNWSILDFDRNEYFSFYVRGDDGRLGFSTTDSDGNVQDFFGESEINDGEWHLACAVYNGNEKILYVDGEKDSSTGNAHQGLSLGSGNTVRFGFIGDGSEAASFNGQRNFSFFEGVLDDVKLYSRVLSSLEIQMMHTSSQGIVSPIIIDFVEEQNNSTGSVGFNPQYPGTPISMTVYEDAEDENTNGWLVYERGEVVNISNGANESARAIKTNGMIQTDVFRLGREDGADWNNDTEFYAEFSVLMDEPGSGAIYFQVNTSVGIKYLVYSDGDTFKSDDSSIIIIGLGDIADREFHTIFRNLDEDLKSISPDAQITLVKDMFIYGSLIIDDIKLLNFLPEEIDE